MPWPPLVARVDPRTDLLGVAQQDGRADGLEVPLEPGPVLRLRGETGQLVHRQPGEERHEIGLGAGGEDAGHRRRDAAPRGEDAHRGSVRRRDAAVLVVERAHAFTRSALTASFNSIARSAGNSGPGDMRPV